MYANVNTAILILYFFSFFFWIMKK
jgi:hypothetical protein